MTMPRTVRVGPVTLANDRPFALVAGPCAMESRDHAIEMADALSSLCRDLGLPFIFKSSFDKGNRTSGAAPTRASTRRSPSLGGGRSESPLATRTRQVEQRPRPPQTEACGMPANRLASRIEKPRGAVTTRAPG